ncbi:hypothetical protein RND71_037499 [Anisodus tanguticus]|uniref:Glycosyltransferase N-terminal domain-containing protein n=1 Tax=Anisodus tanguticus TaxID=243964 RepID=A0AAE1R2Y5_9SOLA|nr:hypothetical protein RND71_037499 [Anisodus tanguticus]
MDTNSSDNIVHLNEVIVAMVPFPEYSHLNQLFILARFIAAYNIPVHFLCLADQSKNLKLRARVGLRASNIHFMTLRYLLRRQKRKMQAMDHIRNVHSLIPNVESYMFHAISAITRYSVLRQSIPDIVDDDYDEMVLQMHDDFPSLESSGGQNLVVFFRMEHE